MATTPAQLKASADQLQTLLASRPRSPSAPVLPIPLPPMPKTPKADQEKALGQLRDAAWLTRANKGRLSEEDFLKSIHKLRETVEKARQIYPESAVINWALGKAYLILHYHETAGYLERALHYCNVAHELDNGAGRGWIRMLSKEIAEERNDKDTLRHHNYIEVRDDRDNDFDHVAYDPWFDYCF